MKILALDLGKFNSICCLFDTKTRKHRFLITPTQREHLAAIFADNQADLVVMEACGPSGWINDLAQSMRLSTLVCSTNEEAWRWANVKRKTDKDDALKLARLAAMRELKAVHTPSQQHREFRSLVKYRKTLDRRINKTGMGTRDLLNVVCGQRAAFTGLGKQVRQTELSPAIASKQAAAKRFMSPRGQLQNHSGMRRVGVNRQRQISGRLHEQRTTVATLQHNAPDPRSYSYSAQRYSYSAQRCSTSVG